jgi:hypothetical protein
LFFKAAAEVDLDETDIGKLFSETHATSTIPYAIVNGKVAAAHGANLIQVGLACEF